MRKIKLEDLLGSWVFSSMEEWENEDIHAVDVAKIKFLHNGGVMNFGFVFGLLDYRIGKNRVDFSWFGDERGKEVSGRGYLTIDGNLMKGKIFFHFGEEIKFTAEKIKD